MSDIKITSEDVIKIANLSKLDVSGQEETFAKIFSSTLETIQVLSELDTDNQKETYQVTGLVNVFQQDNLDSPSKTLTQEKALSNAKENINGLFATEAVFDR